MEVFPMIDNGNRSSNGYDRREKLAEAGDVKGFMDDLAQSQLGNIDWKQVYRQMQRVIAVASEKGPQNFAQDLFQTTTGFVAYASMRLQLACGNILAQNLDVKASPTSLPADLMTNFLPPMIQMQRHLADLLHAWASTMRQWSLVRRHQDDGETPHRPKARLDSLSSENVPHQDDGETPHRPKARLDSLSSENVPHQDDGETPHRPKARRDTFPSKNGIGIYGDSPN
jgi:hypothetical protein